MYPCNQQNISRTRTICIKNYINSIVACEIEKTIKFSLIQKDKYLRLSLSLSSQYSLTKIKTFLIKLFPTFLFLGFLEKTGFSIINLLFYTAFSLIFYNLSIIILYYFLACRPFIHSHFLASLSFVSNLITRFSCFS